MIKAEDKFNFKEGDMVTLTSVDFNNELGQIGAVEHDRFFFFQNSHSGGSNGDDKLQKSLFKYSWVIENYEDFKVSKTSIKDKVDLINFKCLNH